MDNPAPKEPDINLSNLADMRNKIGAYISILESNTTEVNKWLSSNNKNIIISYHALSRAIKAKDENKFLSILDNMGDISGFVLSISNLKDNSLETFSNSTAIKDKIKENSEMFPEYLEEELEDFSDEEKLLLKKVTIDDLPPIEEKIPSGWSVSSWFKGKELEEKRNRLARMKELYDVKSEIMGIQSDRHYYIDGVMDWVIDGLAPEKIDTNGAPSDTSEKMIKYQNPAYIIDLAQKDYKKAVKNRVADITKNTIEYSNLAHAIDTEKFEDIKTLFESLYSETEGFDKTTLYSFLMEDYSSKTLFDLIFKHIKKPELQEKLFMLDVLKNEKLEFAWGKISPDQIFGKFLDKVLSTSYPMSPETLPRIASMLLQQYESATASSFLLPPAKTMNATKSVSNVFNKTSGSALGHKRTLGTLQQIAKRFSTEPEKETAAYESVMKIVSREDNNAARLFVNLNNSDTAADCCKAIDSMMEKDSSSAVMAFWNLVNPDRSIAEKILELVKNTGKNLPQKLELLNKALNSGLLNEMQKDSKPLMSKTFIDNEIISNLSSFPIDTARKFIYHIFSNKITNIEYELASNWIHKIASSNLSDNEKTKWIAAFMEPVESDLVKANILYKASKRLKDTNPNGEKFLLTLEYELIGNDIKLSDNSTLSNIQNIANIWYNGDKEELNYTVNGQSLKILENLSPKMASEIFTVLKRRSKFDDEYSGLFKADNISKISFDSNDNQISWYNATGALNIQPSTIRNIQKRDDFIHVKNLNGRQDSYNIKDICLVEKKSDSEYVIINKYGVKTNIEGDISIPKYDDLIDLGEGKSFNPNNASIMRVSDDNDIVEFRIESAEFDTLLENEFNNEALYSIQLKNSSKAKELRKHIEKNEYIYSSNDNDTSALLFNMKTLDFMHLSEEPSGFSCKKYGYTSFLGFIGFDSEKAKNILKNMESDKNIIRAGNLLTSINNIDNIYYNAAEKKLQILINDNISELQISSVEARKLMVQLSKEEGFYVAAESSGMPIDIVNYKKATLIQYDEDKKQANITIKNQAFYINATKKQYLELVKMLEPKGKTNNLRKAFTALTKRILLGQSPDFNIEKNGEALLKQTFEKIILEKTSKPNINNPHNDQKTPNKSQNKPSIGLQTWD